MRFRALCRAPIVLLTLIVLGFAARAEAQLTTTYFLGGNYGNRARTDPLYVENRFDLFYPIGGCPLSPGCDNIAYPVAVLIHGGNSNSPITSIGQLSPLAQAMLGQGFVVAIPSYHVLDVEAGDDYLSAGRDLARMVQYLRRFRTILNIDPQRVFTLGHSGGGFYSYYLGLNQDHQDVLADDLVERESSRPNYIVSWGAATDWDCMDLDNPATNPSLLQMFQLSGFPDATLAASPTFWLQNPNLYGRDFTPPMCLVYNLSQQHPCGAITDFHDGYFGPLMLSFITRYCGGTGLGEPLCTESALLDSSGDVALTTAAVAAWMAERAGL